MILPNNVGASYITAYESNSAMEGYSGDSASWCNEFTEEGAILLKEDEELIFRGKNSDSSLHLAGANVTIIEEEIQE